MLICQKRGAHLDKSLIPVVEETKFPGIIIDRKLSFLPHLNKAWKALNILKAIGDTEWWLHRKVMLRLYKSLIKSKLDYGCIVYKSTRKSYTNLIWMLDVQSCFYTVLPRWNYQNIRHITRCLITNIWRVWVLFGFFCFVLGLGVFLFEAECHP